jgi:competence protein ComEC
VGRNHAPASQHVLHLLVPLVLGFCTVALVSIASSSPDLAAELDHCIYLPVAARPAPTPTLTPTPTPLPPIPDVRVEGEGSCSSFKGGSREDPNGEYVCFKNYDSQPADMSGWRVEDAAQHSYTFPPFILHPGAIVRLHSGPGSNTATDLHWARGLIWNNDHDIVYLYDVFGRLVDSYVY